MVVQQPAGRLRLVRNPRFRVWASAARPDGHPDAITIRIVRDTKAAIRAVEQGKADYVADSIVSAEDVDLNTLFTRYAGQVHANSARDVEYAFLNTRRAPFDRLDARRAVNYAFDRRTAVQDAGGPEVASPTCQILPPDFPGYRPFCPYTLDAAPGRTWSAPDLATARRLVTRSRTAGMHVTVWGAEPIFERESRDLVRVLKAIGYRASLRRMPQGKYFGAVTNAHSSAQAGLFGLIADYPSAANLLAVGAFNCTGRTQPNEDVANPSHFCDAVTDHVIERAQQAQETGRGTSDALWAGVDRRVVDQAAVVPLANPKQLDFVSSRVGDYQYNPQWGALLDQLWVR
jgi:peptide/nickel transport system substrate-binding protein